MFQHTAARRRLELLVLRHRCCDCFNTQPPEGGWTGGWYATQNNRRFNTQPPEGGWGKDGGRPVLAVVSTHSRPKAAGCLVDQF